MISGNTRATEVGRSIRMAAEAAVLHKSFKSLFRTFLSDWCLILQEDVKMTTQRKSLLVGGIVIMVLLAAVAYKTNVKPRGIETPARRTPAAAATNSDRYLRAAKNTAEPEMASPAGSIAAYGMGADAAAQAVAPGAPADAPDRYLVKTAIVTIETDNARKGAESITAQATQAGGFVANLREQTDAFDRHVVNIEIRVPTDRLDAVLSSTDNLGRVLERRITTQDVTEQYVDNESRIRNLKKTEERLLEHLTRTGMIENTLRIESELTRVREQVEVLEGRHRVLSHQVEYARVTICLTEAPKAESVVPAQSFSIGQVSSEAVRSLVAFGRVIVTKMIWIGVWTPVWLPVALVAWLVTRRFSNRYTQAE